MTVAKVVEPEATAPTALVVSIPPRESRKRPGPVPTKPPAAPRRAAASSDRDRLISEHLGLARHLARRFEGRGEPLDDLVQVASVGLVNAATRFDPSRGMEFTTFAVPTIVGELKRHFRDKGWAVHVPRRLQELHLRLRDALTELTHELGRSPTLPEVAARLEVSVEDVIEGMEVGHSYRVGSLDAPSAKDGEDRSASAADDLGRVDERFVGVEDRHQLGALLSGIPARERQIIVLRFYDGLTQSEIAERMGISQMHVSRLIAQTLGVLRDAARRKS